ncbi:hypothetical protein PM082_012633 [Marasmius tenuissimus]|nr:hypothetical protein PM082_012633 [Marasmius tenuissimus]
MDLVYSKDNQKNATLSLISGEPAYEIYTVGKFLQSEPTWIRKYQCSEQRPVEIGQVRVRSFHNDVCQLRGKDIRPRSIDSLSTKRSFTSLANGQKYIWKRKFSKAKLLDNTKNTIAVYEESHSGFLSTKAPAKISVAPDGMPIIDEIVVTFVYFERKFKDDIEEIDAAWNLVSLVGMVTS